MGAVPCTLLVFLIVGIVTVLLPLPLINSYPKTKQTSEPAEFRDVVITMERGPCFGLCPVYSLTIYGNGTVIYEGESWVNVTGRQVSQISQDEVKELVDEFYRIDYFSLNDSYTSPITCLWSTTTSITIDGNTKSVYNYANEGPTKLIALENKIDETTNSSQWVKPHPVPLDTDGDGIPDDTDSDDDNDGVNDAEDAFPLDSTESIDTDNDGVGNNADTDDDNDGMPDAWEIENGLDPLDVADASLDSDGDGLTNLQEYQGDTDPNISDAETFPFWILGVAAAVLAIGIAVAATFLWKRRK